MYAQCTWHGDFMFVVNSMLCYMLSTKRTKSSLQLRAPKEMCRTAQADLVFFVALKKQLLGNILYYAKAFSHSFNCCYGQQQTIKANLKNEKLQRSLLITPPDRVEACYIIM